MKQLLFFLAIGVCIVFSCKKSDPVKQISNQRSDSVIQTQTILDGKWRMISVKENISGEILTKPTSILRDVDITFSSTSLTDGTFIGNTPTNTIMKSDYSVTAIQNMTIKSLFMTKVMETPWGNEFVDHILNSQEYNFENGSKLTIKTLTKTLTFQKL